MFICHDAAATLATLGSYQFNSPLPPCPPSPHPTHPPTYLLCWLLFVFVALLLHVRSDCCCCCLALNGICRLCVTHARHYPSFACLPVPAKRETRLLPAFTSAFGFFLAHFFLKSWLAAFLGWKFAFRFPTCVCLDFFVWVLFFQLWLWLLTRFYWPTVLLLSQPNLLTQMCAYVYICLVVLN